MTHNWAPPEADDALKTSTRPKTAGPYIFMLCWLLGWAMALAYADGWKVIGWMMFTVPAAFAIGLIYEKLRRSIR